MRKRFEQQPSLGTTAIADVEIDEKSRHELKHIFIGLKYIFITPEVNEEVFQLLEAKIMSNNNHTGRPGMDLWQILVLGVTRLALNIDYDFLHDMANNHKRLRQIMGIGNDTDFALDEGYFHLQTIIDNISIFDEEFLMQISKVVVKSGHRLLKKKENEAFDLNLKTDSYPVEASVHFPTDLNLLWDSSRKALETVAKLASTFKLNGWRKSKQLTRNIKNAYRKAAEIHRKKGKNYDEKLKEAVKEYLSLCRAVENRLSKDLELLKALASSEQASNNDQTQYKNLKYYYEMLVKHIDLVDRRILKGEQIPHGEKVFSIFEPHAEWLAKGKTNHPVEIGHNTSITTDQYHFILTHKVLEKEVDKEQPQPLAADIKANYLNTGFYKLASSSFDRGFYSKENDDCWKEICETVVMPKPGKKSKIRQAEESEPQFKHFKKKHSAVESNINELEHAGVSRVPDRGIDGFKRYVALGVLAYNIKRLGKVIADKEAGKKSR